MTEQQSVWVVLVKNEYDYYTDTYVLGVYTSEKMANTVCAAWNRSYDTDKPKEGLRYSSCEVEKHALLSQIEYTEQEEK